MKGQAYEATPVVVFNGAEFRPCIAIDTQGQDVQIHVGQVSTEVNASVDPQYPRLMDVILSTVRIGFGPTKAVSFKRNLGLHDIVEAEQLRYVLIDPAAGSSALDQIVGVAEEDSFDEAKIGTVHLFEIGSITPL